MQRAGSQSAILLVNGCPCPTYFTAPNTNKQIFESLENVTNDPRLCYCGQSIDSNGDRQVGAPSVGRFLTFVPTIVVGRYICVKGSVVSSLFSICNWVIYIFDPHPLLLFPSSLLSSLRYPVL